MSTEVSAFDARRVVFVAFAVAAFLGLGLVAAGGDSIPSRPAAAVLPAVARAQELSGATDRLTVATQPARGASARSPPSVVAHAEADGDAVADAVPATLASSEKDVDGVVPAAPAQAIIAAPPSAANTTLFDAAVGFEALEQTLPLDKALSAAVRELWDVRFVPGQQTSFETVYRKIDCGALVANLCLWKGQPRYFRPGKKLFTSKGGTMSCNEAGKKYRFYMVMYDVVKGLQPPAASTPRNTDLTAYLVQAPPLPAPYALHSVLVVPYCWELYGYHLVLCMMATYAQMQRAGVAELPPHSITVAVMRGGSFTPYSIGSDKAWSDPVRPPAPEDTEKNHPASYWPLWKSITPNPVEVASLGNSPRRCYSLAVVAGPPSNDVVPAEARAWRRTVVTRLGMARQRPERTCQAYKTVIVKRRKNFHIKNLDEVLRAANETLGRDVVVVELERMTFREQLQLALDADVWLGVHGNGLTWSAMMQAGSALVELWPSGFPYNANYAHFASRANVKKFNLPGDGKCGQRCSAEYKPDSVFRDVAAFLDGVHCKGVVYDEEPRYLATMRSIKAVKAAKRAAKAARGEPV